MRFKYFATAIAAITLAGCSNNDDVPAGNNQPDANKAQAYLKVKINQTGGSGVSRGSVPTGEGASEFEQATADEYSISNAKFYFYDANGIYVTSGNLTNQEIGGKADDTNTKLDFKSDAVVVLENTGKGYPKYMVTVLNAPEGFNAEKKSLEDLESMLAFANDGTVWTEDKTNNTRKDFIMTTSSYLEEEKRTVANNTYFVTEIAETNYKSTKNDAENAANAVQIYVERLAAKVSFNISDEKFTTTNTKEVGEDGNKRTIYKLETVTVAGNNGDNNISTQLYADIQGWGLTNTAKNSYMMMNLGENWATTAPFSGWQPVTTEYRSYWGMSTLYNTEQIADTDLNRSAWNEATTQIDGEANYNYCAEHTRGANKFTKDNLPTDATSVLIKAQLVNENGTAVNYIRYNGLLWTYEDFVGYMCKNVEVYTKDESNNLTPSLPNTYWEFTNLGQGAIKLVLKTPTDTNKLYDATGQEITDVTTINSTLAELVTPKEGSSNTKAIAYENGMMYYTIPIEHLYNDNKNDNIAEGKYGVVRNHYYKLTLTALSKIGHGVFDAGEDIIPEPDPEYYYVGAQINVLSWHVVEQDVEL